MKYRFVRVNVVWGEERDAALLRGKYAFIRCRHRIRFPMTHPVDRTGSNQNSLKRTSLRAFEGLLAGFHEMNDEDCDRLLFVCGVTVALFSWQVDEGL